MDGGDKFFKVGADLRGRLAVVNIVGPGPEEDGLGDVREDEAAGEMGAVDNLRAAEAAVDDRVAGKIRGERGPHPDGGGAGEKHRALGWWTDAVLRLVGGDLGFPASKVVGGRGGNRCAGLGGEGRVPQGEEENKRNDSGGEAVHGR